MRTWLSSLVPTLLLVGLMFASPGWGGEAQVAVDSSEWAEKIGQEYEVLLLEGGLALVPREHLYGIRVLEIRGQEVSVNGAQVTREVLAAWLKEDAQAVLGLMAMEPEARRALLGLAGAGGSPPLPREPPVPPRVEDPEEGKTEAALPSPEEGSEGAPEAVEEEPSASEAVSRNPVASEVRVKVFDDVIIGANEVAEDVIVVGGDLQLEGEILGDALVVAGRAYINGGVSGDVAAIGGTVFLQQHARVHGDVISVGGAIERHPSATVFGKETEVAVGGRVLDGGFWNRGGIRSRSAPLLGNLWASVAAMAKLLFATALVWLVLLILKGPTKQAEVALRDEPWRAGLVGLLTVVGLLIVLLPAFIIVIIILCLTVVGIPIAVLLILAAVIVGIAVPLLGFAAVASRLGAWVDERFPWHIEGTYKRGFVGVLVILGWTVVTAGGHGGGWFFFHPLALLSVFGWLAWFSSMTLGVGAVLLTLYRSSPLAVQSTGSLPLGLPPVPGEPAWDPLGAELPPLPEGLEDLAEEEPDGDGDGHQEGPSEDGSETPKGS